MVVIMPRSLLALKGRYGKSKTEDLSPEDQNVDVEGKQRGLVISRFSATPLVVQLSKHLPPKLKKILQNIH